MTYPERFPLIWVGLGNPGARYLKTRHNVGYEVIDYLSEKAEGLLRQKTVYGELWEGSIHGERIVMIKPTTYMNLSGRAVRWILSEEGLGPEMMVVFHDDIDLDLGRTKIKWKGGDAGHKGIRSIMSYMQTDAFFRVRIGIGRPPEGLDASKYVLSAFTRQEEETIDGAMVRIAEGMEIWANKGTRNALSYLNRRD